METPSVSRHATVLTRFRCRRPDSGVECRRATVLVPDADPGDAMTTPLLTTKLHIPSSRPYLVWRPRLIERLDEGLRLGRGLTLVSAPAGYGKTTLIAQWLQTVDRPVAWLSLNEANNDLVRFLSYLISTFSRRQR